MTLIFNRVLKVIRGYRVHAIFHQTKCSGSRVMFTEREKT